MTRNPRLFFTPCHKYSYLKYSGMNRILETGNNHRDVDVFGTSRGKINKHFMSIFMTTWIKLNFSLFGMCNNCLCFMIPYHFTRNHFVLKKKKKKISLGYHCKGNKAVFYVYYIYCNSASVVHFFVFLCIINMYFHSVSGLIAHIYFSTILRAISPLTEKKYIFIIQRNTKKKNEQYLL